MRERSGTTGALDATTQHRTTQLLWTERDAVQRTGLTLRGPTQRSGRYFAAPPGADGVVGAGAGLVGPAPVVEDGFCFGRLGALAVGGMFTPLPVGLLFEANTNSRTAATNTAAATHPQTALTSPVAR